MLGLLRQAQALESQATAAKLGILRALIRDDDQPLPGGGYHGDLPEGWTKSLTHQVCLALAMPAVSADKLMWAAWDLQARLPGTGALLAAGGLTFAKAKAVHEAFLLLSDEDAAIAESMILPDLPGKTYGQVQKLAEQAAVTVDPESATRRREDAERNRCRVEVFREESGAAALSGRDLPTDQALAAHAHVCARAQEYKDSGAFPGDTRMDQYRVAAYLDLLNGTPAETRIATGQIITVARDTDATDNGERETGPQDPDEPGTTRRDGDTDSDESGPGAGEPTRSGPEDVGPRSGRDDSGADGSGPDDSDRDGTGADDSDRDGRPARTAAARTAAARTTAIPTIAIPTAAIRTAAARTAAIRTAAARTAAIPMTAIPTTESSAAQSTAAGLVAAHPAHLMAIAPVRCFRLGSRIWCFRWPPSSAWPTGPARATASARSTPTCAANWPPPPLAAPGPGCA